MPKDKIGLFTANEGAIYAYVDHEDSKREKPFFSRPASSKDSIQTAIADNSDASPATTYKKKKSVATKSYTVKRGDNLGEISSKYGVSIADLRKWNKIKGNNIMAGQRLKIQQTIIVKEPVVKEAIAAKTAKEDTKPKTTATDVASDAEVADNNDTPVVETKAVASKDTKRAKEVNYEEARMYIVQKGDSLFSIAKKHPGVTVENLKNWNEIQGEKIQPGMKLKIGSDKTL
jgi:membrane-bound lytic murein transglycosylase D